jgi:small-conductance mechanosensitive channel
MGLAVSWVAVRPYVIPAAIIVIGIVLGVAFEYGGRRRIALLPAIRSHRWLSMAIEALAGAVVLWFTSLGIYVAIVSSQQRPSVERLLDQILLVLVLASITIVAGRFVGSAVLFLSRGPEQQLASGTLFASVSQGLIAVLGALIILSSLGIQITPLLTALGVGGLAVALALQPPLANLFSGLQLVASRQIRPGDYVELQTGQQGFVEDINWRNITIREPTNNLVVVPNLLLAQAIFINYRLPDPQVAARVPVRVAYGSDLDFVEQLMLRAVALAREDMHGQGTSGDAYVRFDEFGSDTINLSVRFFVPRVVDQERARSSFLRRLYALLREHGIGSPVTNPVVPPAAPAADKA